MFTDHIVEPIEVGLPANLFRGFDPSFEFDSEPKDDDQFIVLLNTLAMA